MAQQTKQSPTNKQSKKGVYISWGIVILLVILFGRDTILTVWHSSVQLMTLPHYQASQVISQEEFEAVVSDTGRASTTELKAVPGYKVYAEKHLEKVSFDTVIVKDVPAKMYYLFDTKRTDMGVFDIERFPFSLEEEPKSMLGNMEESVVSLMFPREWNATGGMACFSCGCSCYMRKELAVANGKLYMEVSGKDFAIRADRQGIYHFSTDEGKWTKLTPKLEGDFKVTDNGCALLYQLKSGFFKLKTCAP